MDTIGHRLRSARQVVGLTQDQLAERLGVAKTTVSAWELNKTMPEVAKLPMLREQIKVSLDTLICGPEPSGGVREAPPPYVSEQQQLLAAIVDHLKALDAKQLRGLLGFLRASATG